MQMLFSIIFIITSILFGFYLGGGRMIVLLQPSEFLMVIGSAVGVFCMSNSSTLVRRIISKLMQLPKKNPYNAQDYLEMLVFLFYFYRFCKGQSAPSIEWHIENPYRSKAFQYFQSIRHNDDFKTFFCDYMRVIIMHDENVYDLELMMGEDIETRMAEAREEYNALSRVADALPAFGIIGAVLGVINAMSALKADPAILAHRIGGALIGTFLGVFFAYCIVSPICFVLEKYERDRINFLIAVKAGMMAYARGNPPNIIVEFIRNTIPQDYRPSFIALEQAITKHKIGAQNGYKQ